MGSGYILELDPPTLFCIVGLCLPSFKHKDLGSREAMWRLELLSLGSQRYDLCLDRIGKTCTVRPQSLQISSNTSKKHSDVLFIWFCELLVICLYLWP